MPGSAFGSMGEGYLRPSFANSDENLQEAVPYSPVREDKILKMTG